MSAPVTDLGKQNTFPRGAGIPAQIYPWGSWALWRAHLVRAEADVAAHAALRLPGRLRLEGGRHASLRHAGR